MENKSTRQLIEAANRKCEMRWKVLAFNPDEDNKLVKEFKDFDCIDCAVAKKREYLEKNPAHVVEVISESINRKTEAGKEIKVGNQRFYTTNDNGIIFVRKIAPYDDADYYYAVYDPQKVRLVFTQSGGKNKQASMVKYNDTAKQLEEIAKKLIELNKHIQPKMVHESSQKNEGKVNMSKLKNEIQAAVNKYFKDDKDLLEYVHIETKKDKFGRDVLEVRAELGYNSMVKLADYLDKIVTKYDKYAYFDQETSGIMTAVFESAQKNEGIEEQQDAIAKKIADALSAKFGWVLSKEGPYEDYYIGKGLNPINVKIKNDKDLQVQLRASEQPKVFKSVKDAIDFIKSNMNAYGFPGASAFYGKLQSKANKNVERQKARDTYLHDISDSSQKNEDKEGMNALKKLTKENKFIVYCDGHAKYCKTRQEAEAHAKAIKAGRVKDLLGRTIKCTEPVKIEEIHESAQINETRGYKVIVELGVPDNMNNKDIENEVERLLRNSHKIDVVIDVTAERS